MNLEKVHDLKKNVQELKMSMDLEKCSNTKNIHEFKKCS